MIAPGSLVGFALVFVFCTWTSSALCGLTLGLAAKRLRKLGAAAEKRAAALALLVPPVLGTIIAFNLASFSIAPGWLGVTDHCGSHGQHLHLCLVHGEEWASRAWAMILISALSLIFLLRLARLGDAVLRGRRRLRLIESSSTRIEDSGIPLFRAPSERAFCFVAGIRAPRIFVASGLWSRLSTNERRAMLEHEHVHVRHGDLWRSMALSFCTLLGAPLVAPRCRQLWADATERLCDRLAADRCGDAGPIAAALLQLARSANLNGSRLSGALSFLPRQESVKERVIAVLSQERTGQRFAHDLLRSAAWLVVLLTIATASVADTLHHSLETLFGLI